MNLLIASYAASSSAPSKVQIYQGKSVFSGIAIGKIRVYKKNERQVKRVKVENPDAEMARFEEAKAKGIAQLGVLYEKACKEVGEANAAIFEVHQMMLGTTATTSPSRILSRARASTLSMPLQRQATTLRRCFLPWTMIT